MAHDRRRRSALIFLLLACMSPSAHAYIDPNAGGFLFQLLAPLLAIVTGLWLFCAAQMKRLAQRIRRFFLRSRDDREA